MIKTLLIKESNGESLNDLIIQPNEKYDNKIKERNIFILKR